MRAFSPHRCLTLAVLSSTTCRAGAAALATARAPRPCTPWRRRSSGAVACAAPEGAADHMGDHIIGAMSADGSVSARAVVTTELVSEASRLQGLSQLAAAALGRALTCSLLVSESLKDDESFQVKFDGDGPLRGVTAMANGKLESRGYVGNPKANLPPNAQGKIDVGGGVGAGALQVLRTKQLPGETTPSQFTSITQIRSGEVPEDINYYLLESEQREGALAAGVYVQGAELATDGGEAARVTAAGGWYVQLLPFAAEESVARLQENLQAMSQSPTEMVRSGLSAREMVAKVLDGLEPQFSEQRRPKGLAESCPCTEERVMRTLSLLPVSELADIVKKNDVIEAKCEFCGTMYRKTAEEVQEVLDAREA